MDGKGREKTVEGKDGNIILWSKQTVSASPGVPMVFETPKNIRRLSHV